MKKIIYALLALFITFSSVWAGTTTTNYDLYKPSQGETGWANAINNNFDTIDSQMKSTDDATGDADSDSTWTLHNSYPSDCPSGEFVSGIGDTLTCATPTGSDSGDADSDSDWTLHNSYPSPCASGEFVTAIGDTVTCDVPEGSGSGIEWDNDGSYIFTDDTFSRVGINTSQPEFALDVIGVINANSDVRVNNVSVCLSDNTNCYPVAPGGWTDVGATVYATSTGDNVGIGTINPLTKLHVKGEITVDGATSGALLANNMKIDGDDTNKMTFSQTAGTNNEDIRFDLETTANTWAIDSSTGVVTMSAPAISFVTGGLRSGGSLNVGASYDTEQTAPTNGALIQGNVGIGTFAVSNALQVIGTVNATAFVGDGSGLTGISGGSGGWVDGGTNIYASPTTDNVAIGTTTPTQKLHVNGNILLSDTDAFYFGDTSKFLVASAASNGNIDVYTASSKKRLSINNDGTVVVNENSENDIVPLRVETNTDQYALVVHGATEGVGIGTHTPSSKLQVVGTVAATAFTGDGSALTGIGAGGWTDGGTNVYTATTTDNVGIGTTTPFGSSRLTIKGGSGTSTSDFIALFAQTGITPEAISAGTNIAERSVYVQGNNAAYFGSREINNNMEVLTGTTSTVGVTGTSTNHNFQIRTNNVSRMAFDTGGNVGIGTTVPTGRLNIWGAGTGTGITQSWKDSGGTQRMVVMDNGTVGIGTAAPGTSLAVVGTVSATAFVGDGSALTGVGASGWTDGGTNVYPTTTTDAVGIGTHNVVSGSILTIKGTVAGGGSGDVRFTGSNVGIGTVTAKNALLYVSTTGGTLNNAGAGDVYIQNDLEVDGTIYGDGSGLTNLSAGGWTDGGAFVYATTSTDNVGIGTVAPNNKFQIRASAASNLSAHVINTNASGVASFISENDTGKSAQLVCTGGSYAVPNLCGMIVSTSDAFTIAEADGTQNVTISGTGNVGIGSTAPDSILNIPSLKSTTGTRYLCIGTTGRITSSASACSGT